MPGVARSRGLAEPVMAFDNASRPASMQHPAHGLCQAKERYTGERHGSHRTGTISEKPFAQMGAVFLLDLSCCRRANSNNANCWCIFRDPGEVQPFWLGALWIAAGFVLPPCCGVLRLVGNRGLWAALGQTLGLGCRDDGRNPWSDVGPGLHGFAFSLGGKQGRVRRPFSARAIFPDTLHRRTLA
jgi:hypothetical protein